MLVEEVWGTAVAINDRAVLLRGPSGSGKSDLAFRLVEQEGGCLIADDRVCVTGNNIDIRLSARAGWSGKLELRGLGIVTLPAACDVSLHLLVDLVPRGNVPRLAPPHNEIWGSVSLPCLRLCAFDQTTPAKVRLALAYLPDHGFPGDNGQLG